MRTSESIKEIAGAICKMQASLKPADKDNTNPLYKSKYSDINAVWEALRAPLTSNGLSVWQDATTSETGVSVITRVVHSSGEWIEFSPFFVPLGVKKDAHGFGSATSYARRYSLCSALGITSDDDDGNGCVTQSSRAPIPAEKMEKVTPVKHALTDNEALERLKIYNGEAGKVLVFLKDRCARFKTYLSDEIDSFIQAGDLSWAEYCMWYEKKTK